MALNINLSNLYNDTRLNGNINNNEISQTENVDTKMTSAGDDALAKLNAGDVFNGKIIDIKNYDVEILLGDTGETINATMQQALELNIGDKLLFQVKEKNDNQVVIRPVANNEVSMDLVNKSLSLAGLSNTDKNIAIVKELIGNGQPIDRNSIMNMIRLTSTYGTENIDKLVDMTKNGIEVNEENLKQYDAYTNSNHQLAKIMDNIVSEITKTIAETISSEDGTADKVESVIKLFNSLENAVSVNENIEEKTDGIANNSRPENETTIINENTINASETRINSSETEINSNDNIINVSENKINISESAFNASEGVINDNEKIINASDNNKNQSISTEIKSEESTKSLTIENELDKVESFKELAKLIENVKKNDISGADVEKLLKSDKFSEKVKRIFDKELLIDVDKFNNSDKENIKDELSKIYEKMDKIADAIKDNPMTAKNDALNDNASNVKSNLSFLNELNNLEAFVQIPIKFNSGEATGDLYVFNRKRNKKEDDDKITAFLHLDLEHLGDTDVNVAMENYSSPNASVSTSFSLSDEVSAKIVEEHLDELVERLEKLGYKTKVTVDKVEKSAETNNALLPVTSNNDTVNIKRYTLDLRL